MALNILDNCIVAVPLVLSIYNNYIYKCYKLSKNIFTMISLAKIMLPKITQFENRILLYS